MTEAPTKQQADWLSKLLGIDIGSLKPPPAVASNAAFAPAPSGAPQQGPAPPPPPVGPNTGLAKAQADLSAKSVKVGAKGGKIWQGPELQSVSEALDAVPPVDQDAMKGVEIVRVPAIDNNPNTAAEYQSGVNSSTNPATRTRTIEVADATYVYGGPVAPAEQRRKIVHEIGHVVAKKAQNDADFADAEKVVDLNSKIAALEAVKTEAGPVEQALQDAYLEAGSINERKPKNAAERKAKHDDLAASDAKIKSLESQSAAFKTKETALRADIQTAATARDGTKAAAEATRVPKAAVAAGQSQLDASGTAADTAATTAAAATGRLSSQDLNESSDYRRASAAVGTAVKAYALAIKAGNVGSSQSQQQPADVEKTIEAAIKTRNASCRALRSKNAHNPAIADLEPVDKAHDAWFDAARTQARLPDRTPKIQEFVDLVQRNHIAPMTPYAQQNWPFKPEEFFAEAYSFWRTAPGTLAKPLLAWFDSGQYR